MSNCLYCYKQLGDGVGVCILNIKREDFVAFGKYIGVDDKVMERLMAKYINLLPKLNAFIDRSFLSDGFKESYY